MKVDTEILPFFNALICVVSNTVNLALNSVYFHRFLLYLALPITLMVFL